MRWSRAEALKEMASGFAHWKRNPDKRTNRKWKWVVRAGAMDAAMLCWPAPTTRPKSRKASPRDRGRS